MERNIGQNLETREIDRERKVREMLEDKQQICRRPTCPDLYDNVCPCHPFSVSVGTCNALCMQQCTLDPYLYKINIAKGGR